MVPLFKFHDSIVNCVDCNLISGGKETPDHHLCLFVKEEAACIDDMAKSRYPITCKKLTSVSY